MVISTKRLSDLRSVQTVLSPISFLTNKEGTTELGQVSVLGSEF